MNVKTAAVIAIATALSAGLATTAGAYNLVPDGPATLTVSSTTLDLVAPVSGGDLPSLTLYASKTSGTGWAGLYPTAYLYYGTEIEEASGPLEVTGTANTLTIEPASFVDYFTKQSEDTFGGAYQLIKESAAGQYGADPVPEASSDASFGSFLCLAALIALRKRRNALV